MFDEIVDSILIVGNAKKVMKACESNIMEPLKLDRWMAERVLYTIGLICKTAGELKAESTAKEYVSKCCKALVKMEGDGDEGTYYFVCTKCNEPCDIDLEE